MSARGKVSASALSMFIALGVCGALGCDRNEPAKPEAPKLSVDALPKDARPVQIDFDGKLKVVGYKLNTRGPMRPGRNVSVSLYWKADQKLEPGYRLAARLVDGAGETMLSLDDASALRAQRDGRLLHGPESWTPGKLYVDELTFNVPRSVNSSKVQILASVAKGEQRVRVTAGPSADSTSGLVMTAPTGARPRLRITPPPTLRVDKLEANTKIKIDGKLDEPAWQSAPSASFVDTASGKPNAQFPINGSFRILWSKEGFYIGADLKEADIVGGFKAEEKDPHLWTKDALTLMIDPDGADNVDYYEVQIGPQNLIYDTRYDSLEQPRKDPGGPFGHEDWSAGVKSAVSVQGTIDKKEDRDEGYVVEALIPWKAFDKAKKVPPAIGDVWRLNVYAMRDGRGVGWSPILGKGNLHNAARFGQVLWAEKGYVEPAPPAASASAAPADEKPAAPEAEKPSEAEAHDGSSDESPEDAKPGRARVPIGSKEPTK
ncbi:MAG: carbohydrate-binding family 9-like protein [Myxococcota bacterium]